MQKLRLKDVAKLSDNDRLIFFASDVVIFALAAAGCDVSGLNNRDLNKYFYNRNYLKVFAPLALDEIGDTRGAAALMFLHNFLSSVCTPYYDKWVRLYKLLVEADYDPLANVDANETFTTTTAHGHTVTNTGTQGMQHGESISHTGTEQLSHGESISHTGTEQNAHGESINHTGTQTNESGVYGFNSASAVDSNTDTRTDNLTEAHTGTDTRTDNLTEAHTGNDTRTDNLTEAHMGTDTRTDNLTETHGGTDTVTETRRRIGNIGVTQSQQLLESEVRVRKLYQFWDIAFEDIEKVLFINIY